ncbi:MAG TPA: type IV pilin protein [candidate division Zixibacteria bacterium]|nr:type IV pilin protein [candidate division Zixibacteria bacterium]
MKLPLFRPQGARRCDHGFTLIELLVVVAIIALLAAVAIPQFMAYRSRAVDTEMKNDLKNAAIAMESYYAEYRTYPSTVAAIQAVGFRQTDGVSLTITITTPTSYTLTASKSNGSQASFTYDSSTGLIN